MPKRLKSLELHGYKTFANKVFFEFSDSVTAIVGPNGSGKSNIADSLMWVLGEQSYSVLRARKTEDMIYSGSESRSRAGMASATITFDNSDEWLPIDFSEVAITRRAFRDGTNEYLLNGQRVRLKDISELLAESGLAERTYTIIGQGLVDAALSLKADERRKLFEEAAGIGLHRNRREEALRRLDTTKRNLERVEDILAELKPRLASLERQARRALEFEQVRADLQLLLRDWYGYHWHEVQRDITLARNAEKTQEARLATARSDFEHSEANLNEVREAIRSRRNDLNTLHKSLAEYHLQREDSIRRLSIQEERMRSLSIQKEQDQSAINALLEELDFFDEQVKNSEKETSQFIDELTEAEKEVELAQSALQTRLSERRIAEAAISEMRQKISKLNETTGKYQARLEENHLQLQKTSEMLEKSEQALKEAEVNFKTAALDTKSAKEAADVAENEFRKIEAAQLSHRAKFDELEKKLNNLTDHRALLSAQEASIKAEQNVLEQAEYSLSGYASGTRFLLEAAREQRFNGVRGALNTFLNVPDNLETAIAAVLGEFLDAVILEDDPENALKLMDDRSGRGVILPLGELKAAKSAALPAVDTPGYLGRAIDLISAPEDLRTAVELLLGGVIIVKDRKTARKTIENQPAGVRVVTLNGEVFHATGPIFSGIKDAENDRTLLGRARRLRQNETALKRLHEDLDNTDHQISSLKQKMNGLTEEGFVLEKNREAAQKHALEAERELNKRVTAEEQAHRQMIWCRKQHDSFIFEQKSRSEEIDRLNAELEDLEITLRSLRDNLKQSMINLENLELDELQTRASHWVTRAAVAKRAAEDASLRKTERLQTLERAKKTISTTRSRLEEAKAELESLRVERERTEQEEAVLNTQIGTIASRIEPIESEITTLEQKQLVLQKENLSYRQGMTLQEQLHSQTKIQHARKLENLQALRRRIEDDFGLVNFEYTSQISGQTPLPLSGMVEELPMIEKLPQDIEENIKRQRAQLRRIGPINPEAQTEFEEVSQRYIFMSEQMADLQKAQQDIREVIVELDALMQHEFQKTFDAVAGEFRRIFVRLFGGGSARLILTNPEDITVTGIEIEARLPGRRTQTLGLLSGGERSLTAASLVFALLRVSPTPFCVLDEVDAMLDEVNVGRFRELLRELSQHTQFLIVTHNRNTVEVAEVIYGVTMGSDSSSQVLSLKLDEVGTVLE